MCSARDNAALPTLGFPIRASAGHWLFSASPRLIAAVHALHRLLVPRHPPCALTILTDDDRGEKRPEGPSPLGEIHNGFLQKVIACKRLPIPVHWLLCSFQGPRRGEHTTWKPGTWVQRAAGSAPVSQNSTACVQSACADYIGRICPEHIGVSTIA